jgi:hypothetical protein
LDQNWVQFFFLFCVFDTIGFIIFIYEDDDYNDDNNNKIIFKYEDDDYDDDNKNKSNHQYAKNISTDKL